MVISSALEVFLQWCTI